MLGNRYVLHDYHIKLIARYIRDSLSSRLNDMLAWEQWKADQAEPSVTRRCWLTPTGWNLFHPTRLAFEGVSLSVRADARQTVAPGCAVLAGALSGPADSRPDARSGLLRGIWITSPLTWPAWAACRSTRSPAGIR